MSASCDAFALASNSDTRCETTAVKWIFRIWLKPQLQRACRTLHGLDKFCKVYRKVESASDYIKANRIAFASHCEVKSNHSIFRVLEFVSFFDPLLPLFVDLFVRPSIPLSRINLFSVIPVHYIHYVFPWPEKNWLGWNWVLGYFLVIQPSYV